MEDSGRLDIGELPRPVGKIISSLHLKIILEKLKKTFPFLYRIL